MCHNASFIQVIGTPITKNHTSIDQHYENLSQDMFTLMHDLRIAA